MYQIAHKKSDGTFINQEAKEKCVSICWWNVEVFGLFIYCMIIFTLMSYVGTITKGSPRVFF